MPANAPLTVLLVEDDRELRHTLHQALQVEGYRVLPAASLADARALIAHAAPGGGGGGMGGVGSVGGGASSPGIDIALIDLGLPDGDGDSLLAALRSPRPVPLIVISARPGDGQKIRLLDAGADDYLVKPFGIGELLARMRVALRHRGLALAPAITRYQHDGLQVDLPARQVLLHGQPVHLTPTEFKLLARLVRQAGQVVTHHQLLADVWGPEFTEHTHYLRLYMGQLRAKIEADPAEPRRLLTELGVGYRLVDAGA